MILFLIVIILILILDSAAKVGNLSDLTTTAKNTVVAAVNELNSNCEKTANKGQANGYCGLDGSGLVPADKIPDNFVLNSGDTMTGTLEFDKSLDGINNNSPDNCMWGRFDHVVGNADPASNIYIKINDNKNEIEYYDYIEDDLNDIPNEIITKYGIIINKNNNILTILNNDEIFEEIDIGYEYTESIIGDAIKINIENDKDKLIKEIITEKQNEEEKTDENAEAGNRKKKIIIKSKIGNNNPTSTSVAAEYIQYTSTFEFDVIIL